MAKADNVPEKRAAQTQISPEFIERYQLELEKNPRSRVFAPLAEAYRKMGLVEEALRICKVGLAANPEFAGGFVAYAKLLMEQKNFIASLAQLERATALSPDNLLAHSLMGEVLLELRRPKDALKSFKMVLFLNPGDERALNAVRKWEFLTAEEFDEDLFEMRPVFSQNQNEELAHRGLPQREIDRALSLADAFTIRNDLPSAMEVLGRAKQTLGYSDEIENRLRLLERKTSVHAEVQLELPQPSRREFLESLLQRINDRRRLNADG